MMKMVIHIFNSIFHIFVGRAPSYETNAIILPSQFNIQEVYSIVQCVSYTVGNILCLVLE